MDIGRQENLISDAMQSDLDLLDNTSIHSLDEIFEDPTQQTWVSSAKKKKEKRKREGKVVIATRASSRIPKDLEIFTLNLQPSFLLLES
jgi:U3 small nucleolar ribonucleoprotein component